MPQGKMDTLSYVLRDPNDAADELDRLREREAELQAQWGYTECIQTLKIERLQAALRAIADQDVERDLKGNYIVLMQLARAALD